MNVIIVHGSNDTEKEAKEGLPENERHWQPWLKRELEKRGIKVSNELYPKDWLPDYEEWKKVFEKNKINENTILIGHSAGTAFLLRWLSENKKKVKKLILVAPAIVSDRSCPNDDKLKDFEFDSSLKKYFNGLVIFYADDDDEDIINSGKLEEDFERDFNPKAYTFRSTGYIERDWNDLLMSENAQRQTEEVKKLVDRLGLTQLE